jgi:hypothetical protein
VALQLDFGQIKVGDWPLVRRPEDEWVQGVLAQFDLLQRERIGLDLDEACAVLDSLPDLSKLLAKADPELRRQAYEAFQFGIELDRNKLRYDWGRSYRAPSVQPQTLTTLRAWSLMWS